MVDKSASTSEVVRVSHRHGSYSTNSCKESYALRIQHRIGLQEKSRAL